MIGMGARAMALVRINLTETGLVEHATGHTPADALMRHVTGDGPIVVMIHGYKFAPGSADYCPHDHILSLEADHACWKAKSWPRELGLDDGGPGLGIAFGWPARGSIWRAYDRAEAAGRAVATLIGTLRQLAPDRPVHILAHSLGARVALAALPHLPARAVTRAVLLAGAEFCGPAEAALDTPAGRSVEVISVTSRENRPYDRLLERALGSPSRGMAIGRAAPERRNWVTLPIDRPEVLTALDGMGYAIQPPQHWVCHWSSYLRPGVFSLYTALVAHPRPMPLHALRRAVETRPEDLGSGSGWLRYLPHIPLPPIRAGRAAG